MKRGNSTDRPPCYIDSFDIIIAISALEMALKKMGHDVVLGKGVAAAQEILLEGY